MAAGRHRVQHPRESRRFGGRIRDRSLRCRNWRANRPRAGGASAVGSRHRRIRMVERRPTAPPLHQHPKSVARQHPRRLLGARRCQRRAEENRRQGTRIVADVRQVLARRDARRLRAREQHLRRTPERRGDDRAHAGWIRDDDQRYVGLGVRRRTRPAGWLPLEPGRPPDRVLAVRFDRRRHLLAHRRYIRGVPQGHADPVPESRDDQLRRANRRRRRGRGQDDVDEGARRSARALPRAARLARCRGRWRSSS